MRERPILFNGDMVRAILAGAKTQTRRPVKPQPRVAPGFYDIVSGLPPCPFGQPGDRLWVRETWASHPCGGTQRHDPGDGHAWGSPIYRATFGAGLKPECEGFTPWRPSIHMPRWACRILLEIVSVRVERVMDISDDDARAEGFESREAFLAAYRAMYKLSPEANPWVWVVEFKRTEVSA
jgi:AraC-like DNA-binding protein